MLRLTYVRGELHGRYRHIRVGSCWICSIQRSVFILTSGRLTWA